MLKVFIDKDQLNLIKSKKLENIHIFGWSNIWKFCQIHDFEHQKFEDSLVLA